jgi:O-antigen ligase
MSQTAGDSRPFNLYFWVFIALLPFVQAPALIDFTLVPRQLFLGAFILITSGVIWYKSSVKKQVQFGFLETSLLLFLAFQFAASLFAINQAEAAATLSRYSAYVAYFLLAAYCLRYAKISLSGLCKAFLVMATIAVVFTGLEILRSLGDGKFWQDIYAVKGGFGHKNILSAVLMLGIPFLLILYRTKEKIWSPLALVLLLASLLEIFMLRTRGVWLATLVGGLSALIAYALWIRKKADAGKLPVFPLVAAFVIVLLVGGGLALNSNVSDQVTDVSNISKRQVFWSNSLEMIKDHPIIGVGPGNWKVHFPKYGLDKLDVIVQEGITAIQRPHNDYLWVWSEGGVFALLTFLGFFFGAVFLAIQIIRKENYERAVIACILLGGLVGYMFFSFGDFPLERISPVVMLLTFAAILSSMNKKHLFNLGEKIYTVLPIALGLVALTVGYYRWEGERKAVKVLEANAQRNGKQLISTSADAENPFFNMDNYANPMLYFSGIGYAAQQNFKLAEVELIDALEVHPNHILSLMYLGNNYKYTQQPEKALEYYSKALEMAPLNPRLRVSMAELYVQQKKYLEARDLLNGVKLSYGDPRYRELMGKIVAYYYVNYEQEQKWHKMVEYLRPRQPKSVDDFFKAYAELKKKNARLKGNAQKAE